LRLTGTAVRRVEDGAILTGRTRYLDDVRNHEALHCAIVRSQVARGDVASIDVSDAMSTRDVVAVFTADDLGAANGPVLQPTWFPPPEGLQRHVDIMSRPEYTHLLAPGRVRYVGEPVAVVLAAGPYAAADGARRVYVDYEPQDPVVSVEQSRALLGGPINESWPDNLAARFVIRKADVDLAFSRADHVVSGTFRTGRQTGTPIEPRGVLADPAQPVFTVWSSNQAPHWLRDALADYFEFDPGRIRVIAPDVGGGFGIKSMVYPEELLVPALAMRLGSPVKWVETRTENFLAAVHARDQRHHMELALTSDGEFLALRDRYTTDVGAANLESLVVPYNTAAHLQGTYRVPAALIVSESYVTNKAPLSAYRGAGRPEAVFAMERIIDVASRELGLDPAAIRQRNLITGNEMPYDVGIRYRDGTNLSLDGGDYRAVFDEALRRADVPGWRREQTRARTEGRLLGIGFANYVEGTGIGPTELATATVEPDGQVSIVVALPSQGQGHATILSQLAADALGVPIGSVRIRQGDTGLMPSGAGTIASRTAVVVGNAVAAAGAELRDQVLDRASGLLEVDPHDLTIEDGRVAVLGAPARSIPLADCADPLAGPPLTATAGFDPGRTTFAYGTHLAVAEVHPVTGHVTILKYVVVHDCGRLINPLIVEGQVVGGIAQGIGAALSEELVYDESGQLITASFVDYQIPRATDMPSPEVYHVETPSELNPLGVRGIGEAGTIGPPAALAGAIEDAIGRRGVVIDRCPMTPSYIAGLIDPDVADERTGLRAVGGREPRLFMDRGLGG